MRTEDDLMPNSVTEALERSAEQLSDESRSRIRRSVMASIRHDSRAHYFASISHRVAATAAAIGVLGTGVAYAADNALPGQALYEIKRGAEQALVAILPSGALEDSILVGVAGRRAEEAANLARNGAAEHLVDQAVGEVRAAVSSAEAVAGPLTGEEAARIQEQAQDAPVQTREAISNAVNAPDSSGSGGSGGGSGSGGDSGYGGPSSAPGGDSSTPGNSDPGNPSSPGNSGDTTGGAGSR